MQCLIDACFPLKKTLILPQARGNKVIIGSNNLLNGVFSPKKLNQQGDTKENQRNLSSLLHLADTQTKHEKEQFYQDMPYYPGDLSVNTWTLLKQS